MPIRSIDIMNLKKSWIELANPGECPLSGSLKLFKCVETITCF